MSLQQEIREQVKTAMRAKDKERLAALRLMVAAIRQVEIDKRIELNDADTLTILNKMVKQRRDSAQQYIEANRPELAEKENFEISIIQEFLPKALSEVEVEQMIADSISETGAEGMKDMGKLMGVLTAKMQGRADMSQVSKIVRSKLAG
jgi:uncharacterized protein YqeY